MISKTELYATLEEVVRQSKIYTDRFDFTERVVLDKRGWYISFGVIRVSKNVNRTLGGVAHGAFKFIDSIRPLRTALDRKRGAKYGRLTKPYIICINTFDPYLSDDDIFQALFGTSLGVSIAIDNANCGDGFFIAGKKKQNTSVSAILITRSIVLSNLSTPKILLWHNPFTRYPTKTGFFNIPQIVWKKNTDGSYTPFEKTGKELGEILRIDVRYMNKEKME